MTFYVLSIQILVKIQTSQKNLKKIQKIKCTKTSGLFKYEPTLGTNRSSNWHSKVCPENCQTLHWKFRQLRALLHSRLRQRPSPAPPPAARRLRCTRERGGEGGRGGSSRGPPAACSSRRVRLQPPAAARVRPWRRETWTGCLNPFFVQERCDQVVLYSLFFYLAPYVSTWYVPSIFTSNILFGNDKNGICRGMEKLEWHISNLCFCNGISPKCESCSGMDPINPTVIRHNESATDLL
jgi:hypothetical protein